VNTIQFGGIEDPDDWEVLGAEKHGLASVKHMQLNLDSKEDCAQAAVVLERADNLQSLDIHLSSVNPMSDRDDCEDDLPTINMLLGQVGTGNLCAHLKSLRMIKIIFPIDGYANSELLELRGLKELTLQDCRNYGSLLERLAKISLDLHSFSIVEETGGEPNLSDYLDVFFRSLRSPRCIDLTLENHYSDVFDWSSFQTYASTILSMKLPFGELLSSSIASDLQHFCTHASSLQQLSISGVEVLSDFCEMPGGLQPFLVCYDLVKHKEHSD
jgi:hypothetical protein